MSRASDHDQLDLHRTVGVLVQDHILIDKRRQLREILDVPYGDFKAADDQYLLSIITINDLFTEMISSWKSRKNGSTKDLCDILEENGFQLAAGK
jgi:hypothetical protein